MWYISSSTLLNGIITYLYESVQSGKYLNYDAFISSIESMMSFSLGRMLSKTGSLIQVRGDSNMILKLAEANTFTGLIYGGLRKTFNTSESWVDIALIKSTSPVSESFMANFGYAFLTSTATEAIALPVYGLLNSTVAMSSLPITAPEGYASSGNISTAYPANTGPISPTALLSDPYSNMNNVSCVC